MEVVINFFGDGFADAGDLFEVLQPGPRHRLAGAEMHEQSLLPPRADPRDLVERRGGDCGTAARPMAADREAVRLVAQPLQKVEHRVARLELAGLPSVHEESLAAGGAVRPLSDRPQRAVDDSERGD